MMDQLTTDVTENVVSQITGKLLPAISDRYDIPLDELLELVNSKNTKKDIIKARPKKSTATTKKSPVEKASTPKTKTTPNKALSELQEKISAAQKDGKILNTYSGRPLSDTTANRKKYKFFDELGIAGLAGNEKLTAALKLLGAPSRKEMPVHRQAARAKARAKQHTPPDEDEDDESESETEIPAPNVDEYLEEDSSSSEEEPDPPKKVVRSVVKKTSAKKRSLVKTKSSGTRSVVKKTPAKKKSSEKRTVKKVEEPSDELCTEDDIEDIDTVVKLSNLIDEGNAEIDSENNSDEDELVSLPEKGKQPQARYNPKIKQWWNPQTRFVLKRKGIKSFVIGKVERNEVIPLTGVDLKKCKKLGWETDTTVLNRKNDEESESEGESTSESEESDE